MAAAQTGKRYFVPGGTAEVIVTKGGDGELRCGDSPLLQRGADDSGVAAVDTGGMDPVALGKRYKDEESSIEVLVVKAGPCALNIDGRSMALMQPKVLPSAD